MKASKNAGKFEKTTSKVLFYAILASNLNFQRDNSRAKITRFFASANPVSRWSPEAKLLNE